MLERRSKRSTVRWLVAGLSRSMKVRIAEALREGGVVHEVREAEDVSTAPAEAAAIEMVRVKAAIGMVPAEVEATAMAAAIVPGPNVRAAVLTADAMMALLDRFARFLPTVGGHPIAAATAVIAAERGAAVAAEVVPAAGVATSCRLPISRLKILCAKDGTAVVAAERIKARNDIATISMMIGRAD